MVISGMSLALGNPGGMHFAGRKKECENDLGPFTD
jgi:hypothetical protein